MVLLIFPKCPSVKGGGLMIPNMLTGHRHQADQSLHFKSTSFPLTLLLCLYRIVLVGVWKGKQDHHREWGPPCQDLWWNGFRNLDCTIVRKGLHILKHQESIEGFRFKKALPGHHRSITRGDNYIIVRVGRTSDEMFSYPIGVVNNVLGIPIATWMIR